ncbi:E3 ubiquitin-protein ligase Topors [Eurosta solidaginis]|uniref:E3 ubiquitin-protein ligase Topors n=1 Tax=Eurosta solidaginis TaxID=178769 RepID=UPI0035305EC6
MASPAIAEGIAIDATDSFINLSNNLRPLPTDDSSARTAVMATSTSRRGRSNATRSSQEIDNNAVANAHSAVSSTSVLIENVAEMDNAIAIPGGDINSHRTLTPLMRIKLSELSTSSSESEPDQGAAEDGGVDNEDTRRAVSPPPNCAICLGRCKNKCFTDSCMHQFCFKCLCEWSKVKPECPLCKQIFKSIIHNVKSIHQFEEYHVQPPTVQIPHRPMEVTIRSLPYIFDAVVVEGHDWELPRRRNSAHRIRPASSGIFYPSALSDASANGDNANSSNGGSMYNHLVYRNELLDMYRQEVPDAIASSGTLSQLWRRFIYDRRLFALPVCDITGRFRESTARFYRDNPAQVHRLMPWINRDIVCLLRNTEHDVSSLLERINESLLQTNILSPAFRRRLQPFLGAKTSHFIHELNNFARSPYDMIGYDRAVHYLPQAPEEIVIEFSSSASSEDENTSNDNERRTRRRRSRSRNDNEFRVLSRSGNSSNTGPVGALLSFTVSTTSEGTEAPGVTVSINGRSGQSAAINLSTHNRVSSDIIDLDDSEAVYETGALRVINEAAASSTASTEPISTTLDETASTSAAANRSLPPTVTENIELTSSSSDECEFVLERKPPHLRTPELVSLNSESDSDVVFVDEAKLLRKTTFQSSGDERKNEEENTNKKLINQTPSAVQVELNVHKTSDREELYNVGASTSTGLRSSGGGRGVKEIFERSRRATASRRKRNLRSNKSNDDTQTKSLSTVVHRGKRIYESSCTSSNFESSSTTSDSDDEDFMVKRQRTKSQRISRKKKPNRSKRKASLRNNSSSNSRSRNNKRTNCRKRQNSASKINKKQKAKRFKEEATSSDSEYTSDDSQNLIELQRRLQALKEQEKHSETMEKIDKTLNYLIECERVETEQLQNLDSITKGESVDSNQQNRQSIQSDNAHRNLVDEPEESIDVAHNLCVSSTNDFVDEVGNIALEEDNSFSSTVTQTTTATTVTTTAANNRSLSRASATTNNTNYMDNDNEIDIENENNDDNNNEDENCNENNNYNSSETSSTTSSSNASMSSPSLYTASSGGEEEEGENEVSNINEDDGNSLGLQQLLDTASLGDAWLLHQLGNSGANNEVEMSMSHHLEGGGATESNDRVGLSPSHVGEEAVSLPDIENDVGGIFLNQHDSSLVMPFNYDAEGSQSDAE